MLVEPGTYDFVIDSATFGASRMGRPLLKVVAHIIEEGVDEEDYDPSTARTVSTSYILDGEDGSFIQKRLARFVAAVELPGERAPFRRLVDTLPNRRFTADVVHQQLDPVGPILPVLPVGPPNNGNGPRTFVTWVNERSSLTWEQKLDGKTDAELYTAYADQEKRAVDLMNRADEAMRRTKYITDLIQSRRRKESA